MVFVWDVAVNGVRKTDDDETTRSQTPARRHPAVVALVVILWAETAVLAAATVLLVVELLVAPSASIGNAVMLAVIVALAAVWLGFIAAGVLRGQAWTRAAIVVVHVLVGAVAIGSVQGPSPRPDIATGLFVLVAVTLVLLFQKPVMAATSDRHDESTTI
jgi:hypothetical protein